MNIEDIIRQLDKPGTRVALSLNGEKLTEQPLESAFQLSHNLSPFLKKMGLDLGQPVALNKSLTDSPAPPRFGLFFQPPSPSSPEARDSDSSEDPLVRVFLDKLKLNADMSGSDWEVKNPEQVLARVKRGVSEFLDEIAGSIGDSVDYFADAEGRLDENSFSRFLTEIAETVGIECMRLNTLSTSSREENISNWRNKLESACQTNSNSFWNLSDLSFYKSSLMRDFRQFRQLIERTAASLAKVDVDGFLQHSRARQERLLESLNAQIDENHQHIQRSFQKFEEKLDSKSNSETSFQMKAVGLQVGNAAEERGSHMTGFHFIEMINNQATGEARVTEVKSKLSPMSDLQSFQNQSGEFVNQISTKKKRTLKPSVCEFDNQRQFDAELSRLQKGLKRDAIDREDLDRSESDLIIDQMLRHETQKELHKKLGFGFFMLEPEKSIDQSSIYDSSMTHRLLDALLDDNMASEKRTSLGRDAEKRNFSKTAGPEKAGLKDLLSKIKRDMEKKMSMKESLERVGQAGDEIEQAGQHAPEKTDIYRDSDESQGGTGPLAKFRSNTMEVSSDKKRDLVEIQGRELIKSNMINEKAADSEGYSIRESLQRRFKQKRVDSVMSQLSANSTNENWRSRLGEKIDNGSKMSDSQKLEKRDIDSMFKLMHANPKIEEDPLEDPRPAESPGLVKSIQKRLKSLIIKPDKEDKELLKQQVVRASKLTKSITRSILSQNSSVEVGPETISFLVSKAKRTVFDQIRQDIGEMEHEHARSRNRPNLEKRVRDLSRHDLEELMVKLTEELEALGLRTGRVREGVQKMLRDALERMKAQVETPFEELVKENIARLEESKNYVDMMEMENIELEYGMLKLTQMYNEIIETLENNGIILEMPREEEDSEDSSARKVRPFSLKEFREQIKNKVQEEKNELDRNLFEIQEDSQLDDDPSCLQMKSVEIDLEQPVSEGQFSRDERNRQTPRRTAKSRASGRGPGPK